MGTAAYLRVSTSDQTVEHQRLQISSAGITPDKWFTDTASGRDGADRPGFVIAACFLPDVTAWEADIPAAVWKRGDAATDAQVFTDWMLGWAPGGWSGGDDNFAAMMAQLFVESTRYGSDIPTSGAMLCAGNTPPGFMDGDSAQWELSVSLDRATIELVLDAIAQRGGQFADIVTAARQPESPQGKARRAALEQWEQDRDQHAFALIAREAGYGL